MIRVRVVLEENTKNATERKRTRKRTSVLG